MGIWVNADGLRIKEGVEEAAVAIAGHLPQAGSVNVTEAIINYTDLAAYGTDTVLSYGTILPDGARITKVTFYVETAFTSGGSATLEFGLIRSDGSTTYDADGFIAATAVASLTSGATITGSGAVVNTTMAYDGIPTATSRVANFTAGKGRLRIEWYPATAGTHA